MKNVIMTFRSYVRIMLGSFVRFVLGSYIVNHATGIKKVRSNYVWQLHQNNVTKITVELRQEVTIDLRYQTT